MLVISVSYNEDNKIIDERETHQKTNKDRKEQGR